VDARVRIWPGAIVMIYDIFLSLVVPDIPNLDFVARCDRSILKIILQKRPKSCVLYAICYLLTLL
jgi:hypothetical protein